MARKLTVRPNLIGNPCLLAQLERALEQIAVQPHGGVEPGQRLGRAALMLLRRAYPRNDQVWVEQKNGAIGRGMVGYVRVTSRPSARTSSRWGLHEMSMGSRHLCQPLLRPAASLLADARLARNAVGADPSTQSRNKTSSAPVTLTQPPS
jgi:hypothetical protein